MSRRAPARAAKTDRTLWMGEITHQSHNWPTESNYWPLGILAINSLDLSSLLYFFIHSWGQHCTLKGVSWTFPCTLQEIIRCSLPKGLVSYLTNYFISRLACTEYLTKWAVNKYANALELSRGQMFGHRWLLTWLIMEVLHVCTLPIACWCYQCCWSCKTTTKTLKSFVISHRPEV